MTRENGFTLVEVLVVVTILGLVVGVLASSIGVALRTATQVEGMLLVSGDVERLADRFVEDAASAVTVSTAGTCGDRPFIEFALEDFGVAHRVGYAVDRTGGAHRIVRTRCADDQLVQVVVSSLAGDPVVTCAPACVQRPRRIDLDVEFCGRLPDDSCDAGSTRQLRFSASPRGGA